MGYICANIGVYRGCVVDRIMIKKMEHEMETWGSILTVPNQASVAEDMVVDHSSFSDGHYRKDISRQFH